MPFRLALAASVGVALSALLAAESEPPLRREALAKEHDLAAGERVFTIVCAACHADEASGAPLVGDRAAWVPRLEQGLGRLVRRAIEGYEGPAGEMPARGGDDTLADAAVANAVAFLADRALAAPSG